jgi:membrane protease subunit HflC
MLKALSAVLAVLAGLVAAIAYFAVFIVHVNEQAIVLEFGRPEKVINQPGGEYGPGLYFKIPFVQTVDYFDKRILDLDTASQEVTASDQKRLIVDAFARYRIVDPLRFYQTVRFEQNVRSRLGPIVESSLRRVLGGSTFQDLVKDKREGLMKRIAKVVNDEGKEFGLEVVDVRIKRADLPEQNSKNIFDRMRAERQREAAEFRAEGVGAANRIRATADRRTPGRSGGWVADLAGVQLTVATSRHASDASIITPLPRSTATRVPRRIADFARIQSSIQALRHRLALIAGRAAHLIRGATRGHCRSVAHL